MKHLIINLLFLFLGIEIWAMVNALFELERKKNIEYTIASAILVGVSAAVVAL